MTINITAKELSQKITQLEVNVNALVEKFLNEVGANPDHLGVTFTPNEKGELKIGIVYDQERIKFKDDHNGQDNPTNAK